MTVAGLSLVGLEPKKLVAQGQPQAQEPWPDALVERPLRNIAPLPLNPDGSAPEHLPNEAGPLSEPTLWRDNKNQPPQVDYDYRRMRIRVDSRGPARRMGPRCGSSSRSATEPATSKRSRKSSSHRRDSRCPRCRDKRAKRDSKSPNKNR